MLKTEEFNYFLPKSFIAQNPVSPRDSSKLLVFDTNKDEIHHVRFSDIGRFLQTGDTLVVNISKVIPARIIFYDCSHKREIFILKDLGGNMYQVMVKPGKIFKVGKSFAIAKGVKCVVKIILSDGTRVCQFFFNRGKDFAEVLNEIGKIPFPPYVTKTSASPDQYQTVYAKLRGSVAAPTAGLHFTPKLIKELAENGIKFEEVILHVNRGTFLPVKSEYVSDHKMHSEYCSISSDVAECLNEAKTDHKRVIAVGTTSVRVLESCYNEDGGFVAGDMETDIFIYPGKYRWNVIDGLVTNFHLPKSTLLMLVASFLEYKKVVKPIEKLLSLYELAKKKNYRFYSFGDAMLII